MFTSVGKLWYDPHKTAKRIVKPVEWWMILKTDEDIVNYYKWWIKKQSPHLQFENTIWGSHISVNRGMRPRNLRQWGKYDGEKIEFSYTNRIYRVNEYFFCIDAYSTRLEEIRLELGMRRQPNHGFHLTIGRINKLHYIPALVPQLHN